MDRSQHLPPPTHGRIRELTAGSAHLLRQREVRRPHLKEARLYLLPLELFPGQHRPHGWLPKDENGLRSSIEGEKNGGERGSKGGLTVTGREDDEAEKVGAAAD